MKKMLLIGFLFCSFNSSEEQQRELWLLVNPRIFDVVKKADAIAVLQDLIYLSLDQRLSILSNLILLLRD